MTTLERPLLLLGDCLEQLRELPDNSVDSVVTDPPYGLSFMGKKWDYDVPVPPLDTASIPATAFDEAKLIEPKEGAPDPAPDFKT